MDENVYGKIFSQGGTCVGTDNGNGDDAASTDGGGGGYTYCERHKMANDADGDLTNPKVATFGGGGYIVG